MCLRIGARHSRALSDLFPLPLAHARIRLHYRNITARSSGSFPTSGDVMATEQPPRVTDTKEFLAVWNATNEEHFVEKLTPLLPHLGQSAEAAARHLVRALLLASTEAGVAA